MSDTIGERLKIARENKKLSLPKAAEATFIREHYLQALEADDYSVMPSAAQARGFLRNYATFLGIDLDAALAEIQGSGPQAEDVSGPLPQVDIVPPPPKPVTKPRSRPPEPSPRPGRAASPLDALRSRLKKAPKPEPEPASEPSPAEPDGIPADTEAKTRPARRAEMSAAEEQPAASAPAPEIGSDSAPRPGSLGRLSSVARPRSARQAKAPAQPAPQAEAETPQAPEPPPQVPVSAAPASGQTAEQIFREIGVELRRRRELLSLTPDEVDRHIHVRAVFIKALEDGDFEQLPSAVQTRGMLANYAAFLDLDTDAILLRFADSLQASHRARHPGKPGKARRPLDVRPTVPPLRSFMAGDMLFGLAIAVMVVALVVWGLGHVFAQQAQPVALPTAPSISEVLANASVPTALQEVTLIPVADTPLVAPDSTPTPPADATLEIPEIVDPNVAVSVSIVAVERTFMRVVVDGEEVFNGRVVPGTVYPYEATATIEVLAGNGAALRATYNGRDMGLLGMYGEVAHFIYSATAVITPMPPAPPTGTATPLTPTATPTTTPTRTPTVTRTPSGG